MHSDTEFYVKTLLWSLSFVASVAGLGFGIAIGLLLRRK
jgi:hypothetical protein